MSESNSFLQDGDVRCSQSQIKNDWDRLVVSALAIAESVNPYQSDLPEGTILRAVDAVDWSVGQRNCDIRPRLLDKSTGTNRLVDSGSQITVTRKKPSDILDPSFKLVAVNGTKIPTYGIREISVKIALI